MASGLSAGAVWKRQHLWKLYILTCWSF